VAKPSYSAESRLWVRSSSEDGVHKDRGSDFEDEDLERSAWFRMEGVTAGSSPVGPARRVARGGPVQVVIDACPQADLGHQPQNMPLQQQQQQQQPTPPLPPPQQQHHKQQLRGQVAEDIITDMQVKMLEDAKPDFYED